MSMPPPLLQALAPPAQGVLPQERALEAPQRLPRLPSSREQRDPLGFDALREAVIQLAQGASRSQWTDFNLHDPGVTLLEAFCFGLSEDIYASRQSVPELLGLLPDLDPGIDKEPGRPADLSAISPNALARHALYGPREALPCRPTSASDYQRWLYDLWPEARHLRMTPLRDRHGRRSGLWHLSRQAQVADQDDREQALAQTRSYWAQRNLGEDLLDAQQLLKPRWVRLRCRVRSDGRRDLAELLAELLARCDDYIAARPLRHALDELPDAEHSGPLMSQGWVNSVELERCQAEELKFNDLTLYLREIPGLADIDELRLEESAELREHSELNRQDFGLEDGAPPPALLQDPDSLPMRGPGWALRLAWPASAQDLEGWNVSGQGSNDQLPLQQLWQQLEDVRRTPRRQALPGLPAAPTRAAREPSEAEAAAYVPASSHLPEVYRQPGRQGASLELQAGGRGQQQQWQAYLSLMEQWLAHSRAQRQHLGELFDIGHAKGPSYWWDLPGNAQLSALEAVALDPHATAARPQSPAAQEGLYLQPREQIERDVFAAADEAVERRSRVLDQLLALHGEQLDFQALQSLPCYWSGPSWQGHLLRCKQRYARQLLARTRDRHAAFDYSKALLGKRKNRCALAERLALQLGMAHPFPRRLTQTLRVLELQLLPEDRRPEGEVPALAADGEYQALHLLPGSRPPRRGAELRELWQMLRSRLPGLRQALPPALLRSAVQADRFILRRQPSQLCLCLGGERRDQRWTLARVASEAQALQLATDLHLLACALQRHAEGLHLVEHLLLRPAGQAAATLAAFHRQKISLILPGWTARGADPRFQSLCQEALLMAAPAHLESRSLFLDAQEMERFEQLYEDWLDARRAHCSAQLKPQTGKSHELAKVNKGEDTGSQLSACAAALSVFLQPFWVSH
ncbi:hypothetical protein LNV23_10800 [Paucibacter sp. DJ1R-11]|uniref:hypothetical protein n=1 Tax=Paucibacter sp. DJ1R-11 TaxID=2893556 RepID=UPI0021E4939A|nr:hypothetical protein [Paucibacter sp. DJ1R-11]MCV2363936.1 hypothetical protein [Paucibacter sp. DJ1R-11]